MALPVLRLAFGAVLTTSVNHDLHLPFAPRILIHKFIDKYSNYNSVKTVSNFMQYWQTFSSMKCGSRIGVTRLSTMRALQDFTADSSAASGFFKNWTYSSKLSYFNY